MNHNSLNLKKIIEVLTPFFLLVIIIILLLKSNDQNKENNIIIDSVVVKKPTNYCRAHFSGLLMNDSFLDRHNSLIFIEDGYSEYVGEGEYPRAKLAFPNSHKSTFDGIAIDEKTRVIIYKDENFRGDILLDINGPAIINNVIWKGDASLNDFKNRTLEKELEDRFPKKCRIFSKTDMHKWSNGSLKVICYE